MGAAASPTVASAWTVLDTDFGDGQRFLALWRQWRDMPGTPDPGRLLHYVGLRPQTTPWPRYGDHAQAKELDQALAKLDGRDGFERLLLDGGRVSLTLCTGDACASLGEQRLQADVAYVQPRAPGSLLLAALAKCCKRGTRLHWLGAPGAADAGNIQALTDLGFRQGDAAEWIFDPPWPVRRSRQTPRSPWTQAQRCTVIGAGIAGAAVAHALALRGWQVQVLDGQVAPAGGASGVPAGLVSPVLSADDGPVSQLTRAGCALARQHAQALLEQGEDWEASGAWLQRHGTAPKAQASEAQWLPTAFWLKPAAMVRGWLAVKGITFRGNAKVHCLRREGNVWVCLDSAGQVLSRSALLVVSNALDAARLLDAAPGEAAPVQAIAVTGALSQSLAQLQPRYGGLSIGPQPQVGDWSAKPLQGKGNFLPSVPSAQGRIWLAGAGFEPAQNADMNAHHRSNRARLAQLSPAIEQTLAPQFDESQVTLWQGQRCVSHDRLPLVGAVEAAPDASVWICAAMGARGLTLAALCAELLAAKIHGEPLPLPARLCKLLDAQRAARRTAS